MKLSQIRALIAVAEFGNFSEAALMLQLSQPAVSHAIATLETELGVPLFSRGRHGAILTPAGERILHHAQQALQHLDLMQQEAYRSRGLQGGDVRIASLRSFGTHLLPKAIAQFRNRYPDVTVTILERASYIEVEHCVREGRADIGMTYVPTSDEFRSWELLRDEFVALLPPSAIVNTASLSWEHLAAYPVVMMPLLPCGQLLHEHVKQFAPLLKTASEFQEDSTIVSLVAQDLGVAILPLLAAAPIPANVQVYSLPVFCERVIGMAVRADTLHVPAVFAFLELLQTIDFNAIAQQLYPTKMSAASEAFAS